MQIDHAEFVLGATRAHQYPPDDLPEVAFAGRSNVGKSSLMNRLLGRRKLVRVSGTPGCTREINFFRIQRQWWFVDLPGYGYAKVKREQQRIWDRVLGDYLAQRRTLRAVVLLLDLRRGLTDLDREMIAFLEEHAVAWLPVATKADKLNSNPRRQAAAQLQRELNAAGNLAAGPLTVTSSLTGMGMDALWEVLLTLLVVESAPGEESPPAGPQDTAEGAEGPLPDAG